MTKIWLRAGMVFLTLLTAFPGLWAALFPERFYNDFPTPARGWLRLHPPFNEHFTVDFGLAMLQFAVVLAFATVVLERRIVYVVLTGFLVFHVTHAAFHLAHLSGSDIGVQLVALLGPVVAGVAVLALNRVAGANPGVGTASSTATAVDK